MPGASMTQAFGVNDRDEVVGAYTTGSGSSAKTYGFTWTRRMGFRTVNDPMGVGSTLINGVNDAGDLVGFYNDAAGNTHGLLWAADRHMAPAAPMPGMSMMPSMTPAPSMSPSMSPMPGMSPTPKPSMTPMPGMSPTPAPTSPGTATSPPGGPW